MKNLVVLSLYAHTMTPSSVPVNVNEIYLHDEQKVSVFRIAVSHAVGRI
jgi:hypothetical protein